MQGSTGFSHKCITELNFDWVAQNLGAKTRSYMSVRLLFAPCELVHIV
jgi:hypothetical protein